MSSALLPSFKALLTKTGQRLSDRRLTQLEALTNYVRLGGWMRRHEFHLAHRAPTREEVWDDVIARVKHQKVLYLEFGVAGGESIRYWSNALQHPESVLHGFDSFEGMPEDGGIWKKGQFSTEGNVPLIDDPRVTFFKGWFDQTLPNYTVPPHDQLIVNMDADIYSSTIYVLRHLRPFIQRGTYIYFDEMNHVDHEPRALDDFVAESGLVFGPVSSDKSLAHMFLECLGHATPPAR